MPLAVIGLSYQQASLEQREKFARLLPTLLPIFSHHVFLETCNRVELYFSHKDPFRFFTERASFFQGYAIFFYQNEQCFEHLMRVTSGCDSALFGETEVQGQVKRAYLKAKDLNFELHFLFQKALHVSKKLRLLFPGLSHGWSSLIRDFLSKKRCFKKESILLIGSCCLNQSIIQMIYPLNPNLSLLCDKKIKTKAQLVSTDSLERWFEYDIIIVATKQFSCGFEVPLWGLKTSLILDLSVPRKVPLSLSQKIDLYNTEDLYEHFGSHSNQTQPIVWIQKASMLWYQKLQEKQGALIYNLA